LYVVDGQEVLDLIAEGRLARARCAHTEKVTKDVASDLAGEVFFADLVPEEKPTVKATLRQRLVKAV